MRSEVLKLSQEFGDPVRITHPEVEGQPTRYTDYVIINANQLKKHSHGNYVAKMGRNLRFNRAFTEDDPQFGGTLTAPAFVRPKGFRLPKDEVLIDDPNWLVFVCAADRVRNDVTRKDLHTNLINQANKSMAGMKETNESQIYEMERPWSPTAHTEEDWTS